MTIQAETNDVTAATYDEYKQTHGKKKVSAQVEPVEIKELFGDFSFLDEPPEGKRKEEMAEPPTGGGGDDGNEGGEAAY